MYYRRNVILFEAYNTGAYFVKESEFKDEFRVFYSHGNHFDSIFTNDYVHALAFCQGTIQKRFIEII